ncbi:MAG: twin-arginine translocase subunit TatC [Methanocellales archaeon]|nr:twin-arginine translocase subunit TatC [Methanocellales archaeon]
MNKTSNTGYSTPPCDKEQPLMEHIAELRYRLLVILAGVSIITAIVFPFSSLLLDMIWDHLVPPGVEMVVYGPWEIITVRITLSLVCALVFGIPLLIYELLAFANPGLFPSERRFFTIVVPFSLILFIIGGLLAYFIVLPLLFKYLILFSGDVAVAQLSIRRTFSVVTTTLVGLGLVFQTPLLITLAVKMGLVKYRELKEKRLWIYAGLLVFATFISPDPTAISQLIVASMLVVLFEASLLIARFL